MEGSLRLRRVRMARGVPDLDMEALRKRQEQRMAMKADHLSPRSSPGSGKSSGKSSPDTPKASRRRPQPTRPPLRPTMRLLPAPPAATNFPPPPILAPGIPTDLVPSVPPPSRPSRPTAARPDITERPLGPPPPALGEVFIVSSEPPRFTTTAFRLPPPVLNAGSPQTSKSPKSPKSTKRSSFSFSVTTASTTSTSSTSTSISSISTSSSSTSSSSISASSSSMSISSTLTSSSSTSISSISVSSSTTSLSSISMTSSTSSSASTTRFRSSAPPVETGITTSAVAPPPPPPPASTSRARSSVATTASSTTRGTTLGSQISLPQSTLISRISPTATPVPPPTSTAASSVTPAPGLPVVTGAKPQASNVASSMPPSETSAAPSAVPVSVAGGGSDSGATAGITVGTIAGVGMLAALIFFFFKKYKRRQGYLDQSYTDGSRGMSGGGKQPTIFATIQERFHNIAAPISSRFPETKEKGPAGGGVSAGAVANVDPKTQSQIINEMFQAAYAAENGMGDNNSTYRGSGYPTDKAFSEYYSQQDIPQGTLRDSLSKWLRGSGVNPLQQNPARDSSQSRFTAPSWTRSNRSSTRSSMLSEGDGVTQGVNSAIFPAGFTPASPLPPVPPLPPAPNMHSRWSESTGASPPNMQSRWSESTRAPPETPSVSHDSLYSMYKRDTQISGATDSVVPEVPEWWRNEQGAVVSGSGAWESDQRASNNSLSSVEGDMKAGLPRPSGSEDAHLSLKQPVPAFPRDGSQGIVARLEDRGRI